MLYVELTSELVSIVLRVHVINNPAVLWTANLQWWHQSLRTERVELSGSVLSLRVCLCSSETVLPQFNVTLTWNYSSINEI